MRGIYVHIPFCLKKCPYCDFNSYAGLLALAGEYVDALFKQIDTEYKGDMADTLYFGGGTPVALPAFELERLLDGMRQKLSLAPKSEVTMEANVSSLNADKLKMMRRYGVNRLSLGLQSADDAILRDIGRTHTAKQFRETYELARDFGFDNISVDLMFGLPGQREIEADIDFLRRLNPEHISAYSLTIAENTPFAKRLPRPLPSEEAERQMYHALIAGFRNYEHYEISNFAKKDRYSRHNMKYWTGGEYYAFGAGASGFLDNVRFTLEPDPMRYIRQNGIVRRTEREVLSKKDLINEFLFLSLRLKEGIDAALFQRKFGLDFERICSDAILQNLKKSLIYRTEKGIALTELGLDFANQVMCDFMIG